jgi:5'-nucleotidase
MKPMKILLTNDDGFGAAGLKALEAAAAAFGEVFVVAPERQFSGCSHQVTTEEALTLHSIDEHHFILGGTPADCVRVALSELVPDAQLMLTGINAGGNLGLDVYISGTVAAAREAVSHGLAAIAFSHYRRSGEEIAWGAAGGWVQQLLARFECEGYSRPQAGGQPGRRFFNVNFPHSSAAHPEQLPETVFCPLDPSPLPLAFERLPHVDGGTPAAVAAGPHPASFRYAGNYHRRRRLPGHDVEVCMNGKISITPLTIG